MKKKSYQDRYNQAHHLNCLTINLRFFCRCVFFCSNCYIAFAEVCMLSLSLIVTNKNKRKFFEEVKMLNVC